MDQAGGDTPAWRWASYRAARRGDNSIEKTGAAWVVERLDRGGGIAAAAGFMAVWF